VSIFGTATSNDFARYEIAYGPDPNPCVWTTFATADIVLTNAQIGVWETSNLPPGTYALRLQVFRSDGSVGAEDFVTGLVVGPPSTPTPAATPTNVPPAPTFESETLSTIQPTVIIEQPPTATPEPTTATNGLAEDAASSSPRDSGGLDLSRFTGAFVDGATCAVGAFMLLGVVVIGRYGLRWALKYWRERAEKEAR